MTGQDFAIFPNFHSLLDHLCAGDNDMNRLAGKDAAMLAYSEGGR